MLSKFEDGDIVFGSIGCKHCGTRINIAKIKVSNRTVICEECEKLGEGVICSDCYRYCPSLGICTYDLEPREPNASCNVAVVYNSPNRRIPTK